MNPTNYEIQSLDRRLKIIEKKLGLGPQPAPPPPPLVLMETPLGQPKAEAQPAPASAAPRADQWKPQSQGPTPPTAKLEMPEEKDEFWIGSRLLPFVGACLLILGSYFLAKFAYDRGWITPALTFAAEILGSFAIFGAGVWLQKKETRYGMIVQAVGAVSLFITWIAGHYYQQIVPLEALLPLCFFTSVPMLAYGAWRSDRPLVWLGLVGCAVSAYIPGAVIDERTAMLVTLIGLSGVAVMTWKKWTEDMIILGVLAPIAMVPPLGLGLPWKAPAAGLLASPILPMYLAFGAAFTAGFLQSLSDRDESESLGWLTVMPVTCSIGLVFLQTAPGFQTFWLLAFAALLACASFVVQGKHGSTILKIQALILTLFIAPWGMQDQWTSIALMVVGAGAVGWAFHSKKNELSWFALAAVILSLVARLAFPGSFVSPLSASLIHMALLGAAIALNWKEKELGVVMALFAWPLIGFCLQIAVSDAVARPQLMQASVAAFVLFGLAGLALGDAGKSTAFRLMGFVTLVLTWLNGILGTNWLNGPIGSELTVRERVILTLVCFVVSQGLLYLHRKDEAEDQSFQFASAVWGGAVLLYGFNLLLPTQIGLSMTLAAAAYGVALLLQGFAYNSSALRWTSYATFLLAVSKMVFYDIPSLDEGPRIIALFAMGGALMASGWIALKAWGKKPAL